MYCNVSQNTDRIGIISASAAYCEAGAAKPSLNSYVQDFLIYLTFEYCVRGQKTGQGRSRTGHIY